MTQRSKRGFFPTIFCKFFFLTLVLLAHLLPWLCRIFMKSSERLDGLRAVTMSVSQLGKRVQTKRIKAWGQKKIRQKKSRCWWRRLCATDIFNQICFNFNLTRPLLSLFSLVFILHYLFDVYVRTHRPLTVLPAFHHKSKLPSSSLTPFGHKSIPETFCWLESRNLFIFAVAVVSSDPLRVFLPW